MAPDPEEWLLDSLQEQLNSELDELRDIRANSKGAEYEKRLSELLRSYFGGNYDIHTRAAIIDPDKKCFSLFDFLGEEELDVVAAFKQAKPRVVFETGRDPDPLSWIPYEGVAFVCEVKSELNKSALDDDLGKLRKVRKLHNPEIERFGPSVEGKYTIEEPLRCLVYDTASIADDTLENLLLDNFEDWHIIYLVEDDTIILNADLPIASKVTPSSENFGPSDVGPIPEEGIDFFEKELGLDPDPSIISLGRGLIWFITAVSLSVPDPISVSTINSIQALTQGQDLYTGATTNLEDIDEGPGSGAE